MTTPQSQSRLPEITRPRGLASLNGIKLMVCARMAAILLCAASAFAQTPITFQYLYDENRTTDKGR